MSKKMLSQNQSQYTDSLKKRITMPITKDQIMMQLWCQTSQERPFTTRLFREADCAIYIADITRDVDKNGKNLVVFNNMLSQECKEDIYRVLIANKADLTQKRRMLATEGMTLAMENGIHQYFEVASTYDYNVT